MEEAALHLCRCEGRRRLVQWNSTLHNIIKGRSDLGLTIRHSISVQVGDGLPRGKLHLGTGVLTADETLHQVKDRPAVQSRLSINAFGHVGVGF